MIFLPAILLKTAAKWTEDTGLTLLHEHFSLQNFTAATAKVTTASFNSHVTRRRKIHSQKVMSPNDGREIVLGHF